MKTHKQNFKWHLLSVSHFQHYLLYFNLFKQKWKLSYWELRYHHLLSVDLFHFMNIKWNVTAGLLKITSTSDLLLLQNFIMCFLWWKALSHKMYCLWWWVIYQAMRWMVHYWKSIGLSEYICSQTTVNHQTSFSHTSWLYLQDFWPISCISQWA